MRSKYFPDATQADEFGFLGVGGRLDPDWLVDAYSHGIFPWPSTSFSNPGQYNLAWFSLDPRCVFQFDRFHVSRRLERTCRSNRFRITTDRDFEGVIRGCAGVPSRQEETWITEEMIHAYVRLHRLGLAHSVESWQAGKLVGGVYGVAIQGLFAAESMFYLERDASKVALVALVRHLKHCGFQLLDIQMITPHTAQFGAVEISRDEYLRCLHEALKHPVSF